MKPPGSPPAPARIPGSFRDPCGFLFRNEEGTLLRQVNGACGADYASLMATGLYRDLLENGLLVEHEEVDLSAKLTEDAVHVLRPREVSFISYPYEWPFSALKHAALLTLEIQRRALGFGMTLKDASGYNVQFDGGKPIWIDTLSFERYVEGRPWAAYGQFCRHFLAPLALMAAVDVDLGRLLALHIDGVPLDLASRLLPRRTLLGPGLLLHLHLHAWMVRRYSATGGGNASGGGKRTRTSKKSQLALVESLKGAIRGLRWQASGTEWADYYDSHSYSESALDRKREIVSSYLEETRPRSVWDLGANTGVFSRLAARGGALTVAFDVDPACVERNYLSIRKDGETRMLALRQDLTSPSTRIGWSLEERMSLMDRGPADAVMALALLHHLAISNNVPFEKIVEFLSGICAHLVIEYVPKSDPQAQRLLASREDIFEEYDQGSFERAFGARFEILRKDPVGESGRVLYLMKRS